MISVLSRQSKRPPADSPAVAGPPWILRDRMLDWLAQFRAMTEPMRDATNVPHGPRVEPMVMPPRA